MTFINQRKDHLGNWEPVEDTESVTVSPSYPYIAELSEIPASGVDIPSTSPPTIVDYTETTNGDAIAEGEFFVNYRTGVLTFHSSAAGETLDVTYWKTGNVIDADHINDLSNRLVHMDRDPLITDIDYEIGTLWVSTTTDPVLGTIRKLWILSDLGEEATWNSQISSSISIKDSLDSVTSVSVYSDGRIEFLVLDELAAKIACNKKFFCYGESQFSDTLKIGNISFNPTQVEPTGTSDISGVLGEMRFVYDSTSGVPLIFFKSSSGWYKTTFSSF